VLGNHPKYLYGIGKSMEKIRFICVQNEKVGYSESEPNIVAIFIGPYGQAKKCPDFNVSLKF
jgi:hypothetical protein